MSTCRERREAHTYLAATQRDLRTPDGFDFGGLTESGFMLAMREMFEATITTPLRYRGPVRHAAHGLAVYLARRL